MVVKEFVEHKRPGNILQAVRQQALFWCQRQHENSHRRGMGIGEMRAGIVLDLDDQEQEHFYAVLRHDVRARACPIDRNSAFEAYPGLARGEEFKTFSQESFSSPGQWVFNKMRN